jgi:hypothetical protein
LTKYQLQKSLPLIDIENSYDIDISRFTDKNHPFNHTDISSYVILPKTKNDTLFFHGFKSDSEYDNIKKNYGNSVLECEEMCVTYKDNTIFFEKNSFLTSKIINENVDFIVRDLNGNIVEKLENQELFNYWVFYISNVFLDKKYYIIEIIKSSSKQKIYGNILFLE